MANERGGRRGSPHGALVLPAATPAPADLLMACCLLTTRAMIPDPGVGVWEFRGVGAGDVRY